MGFSRRDLLAASAVLLTRPGAAALGAELAEAQSNSKPIVLCWNENPYGPSPAARAAINAAISQGCRYPDDDITQLVQSLAKRERMPAERIVTGTGSGELLRALGLICGRDGGEILVAEPTYLELPQYAQGAGATLKFVPVDKRLRLDLTAMRTAVNERTRAIYICNPNNPTGTAIEAPAIQAFVASLPEQVLTIVDEAYLDFADHADVRSISNLINEDRRVVVLRTFSKIHGMAGIRCGYALTRPDIAAKLAGARMTTPNIFAVRAARASLDDTAFLSDCRRRITISRKRITTELSHLGLAYAEPQGNFVFFNTGVPLEQFTEFMRKRGILVGRRFAPYDTWCRITIGTEAEVDAFLGALSDFGSRRA